MRDDIPRIPDWCPTTNFPKEVNEVIHQIEGELTELHLRLEYFEHNLPDIIAKFTIEALREYLKLDKED